MVRRARGWLWRLGGIFHRERGEREFAAELEEHLRLHIEDNLRAGMTAEESRRQALVKLGGVEQTKELYRERRGVPWLETLWRDVRYGGRMLRKSPGFTLVAVLTLALGIGANTAIFSVVDGVLLRPLPYPNHERLVEVQERHPGSIGRHFTYATFLDLERQAGSLENVSAWRPWEFNLTGGGTPEKVPGAMVSADFFPALGTHPLLGRIFRPEEDTPGGDSRVAILGYGLWQRRFGGDRGVIGKRVTINSVDHTVTGVMPAGFDFPGGAVLWTPLVPGGSLRNNRRAHLLTVVADLKPGSGLARLDTELSRFSEEVERRNPGVDLQLSVAAVSLKRSLVAPVQPALLVLFAAVGLLLLVACANVANLLLARAAGRRKEIAVRLALGASRGRLGRQLLIESLLLAGLGGAAGLGLAIWSLRLIVALGGREVPRLAGIGIDWRVLGFTFLVCVLTGLLFGLGPALRATKVDLNPALKEGPRGVAGGRRSRTAQGLVVAQFGLAMVLVVGAGLLAGSFARLLRVEPGFDPKELLTMEVFLSPMEYREGDPKIAVVLGRMLDEVRALPGVRSAAFVNSLPIAGGPSTDFTIGGRPAPPADNEPEAAICSVSPGYFRTMRIPLLAGRTFTTGDGPAAARVMVINQTLARTYWPNESPIGHQVMMKDWGPPLTGTIVGVVGDVKVDGLETAAGPTIYWPYSQFPVNWNALVVRGDAQPMKLVDAVESRIWSVDKNQPISRVQTMEEVLSDSLAQRRLYLILLGTFAGAALLLAAVGIYGVISCSVASRRHEIGVRMALGAAQRNILWLIAGQGAWLAMAGVAVGVAGALALTRLMASLLFGVEPSDPTTFAGAGILLVLVALGAGYVPARRAARVDPMAALRQE
jgi:putative ABC transport system permease protein